MGIEYKLTGDRARGQIAQYHYKPAPLHLGKGAKRSDISGLKSAQTREVLRFEGGDYSSKFTIGMEVEKNELHRNVVREYELFCGFERDGSCGYEAVTHILPLIPASMWRTKVFDMMHKAEKIIDDRFSPSDKRCGGHITIAVEGMTGDQLREAMRKNCGIVLALFRMRLNTLYCGANRRMQPAGDRVYNSWGGACRLWNGDRLYQPTESHYKYQTALVKDGNLLEFRLPSRFQSVKQMMRRYELFYEIVNYSVNKPNGTHDGLLKTLKPIIVSMYDGNVAKAEAVMGLAKHFREFILKGKIHGSIAEFLQ
jgi:hypothetical protein